MMFSSITERTPLQRGAGICICCAVWVLCAACALSAQALRSSQASAHGSNRRASTNATHSATARKRRAVERKKEAAKPLPPSDVPAQPATVSLKNGKLTIEANNSDLTQILRDIAAASGMAVEGMDKSARIFGAFGPGNPRDVLTALLAGSGYNFVMAGERSDGAPRELLLTAQSAVSPSAQMNIQKSHSPVPNAIPSTPQVDDSQAAQEREERMQETLERLQAMHDAPPPDDSPQ